MLRDVFLLHKSDYPVDAPSPNSPENIPKSESPTVGATSTPVDNTTPAGTARQPSGRSTSGWVATAPGGRKDGSQLDIYLPKAEPGGGG